MPRTGDTNSENDVFWWSWSRKIGRSWIHPRPDGADLCAEFRVLCRNHFWKDWLVLFIFSWSACANDLVTDPFTSSARHWILINRVGFSDFWFGDFVCVSRLNHASLFFGWGQCVNRESICREICRLKLFFDRAVRSLFFCHEFIDEILSKISPHLSLSLTHRYTHM